MPDLKDIDMVGIIMVLAKCFYAEFTFITEGTCRELFDVVLPLLCEFSLYSLYFLLHQC